MNTHPYPFPRSGLALGVSVLLALQAAGAAFDSTSTGVDGDLNITQDTQLEMPANGVFNFIKITVAGGATLSFKRNSLNTPVVLLAQEDVVIQGNISVAGGGSSGAIRGEGGPGGFDGGNGGFGPSAPASRGGDGQGPGRGTGASGQGDAAYASPAGSNNRTYGNVLINPLVGGSGGAGSSGNPGTGGSGGGGAILIASSTRIVINGLVNARGGFTPVGNGSGGSVRLVAPTGGGAGRVWADAYGGASSGRIRVDCTDPNAFRNLNYSGTVTRGTRMYALPPPPPKLSLVSVAGRPIAANEIESVQVSLPAGSSPNQEVVLRGTGFPANTPVQVAVIPEHSASVTVDGVLNGTANPPEVVVPIVIPAGEPVTIQAWAR
ncbi:MAG: hypothetical protein JNL10_11055 [Verrucomicrobiales bacterium]|nr:hypothetical protein [Verrucomicrobiales bacterium]